MENDNLLWYAGIGNRYNVPGEVLELIGDIAALLEYKGFTLRSGGAIGCDKAFEDRAQKKLIYRPRGATTEAIEMASKFHDHWDNCSDYVRKLHGRNCQILLGVELNRPVRFVVCYASSEESGGTALGLRIARHHNIPVFNLANADSRKHWEDQVLGKRNDY